MLMEDGTLKDAVFDVKVPTERITENRDGKRVEKEVRIWPGYVLVEMDLPDQHWKEVVAPIRRINGVSGFVGSSGTVKPNPISNEEVKTILMRTGDIKADRSMLVKTLFHVGEELRITEGPFASFTGAIEEVNADKQKLKITVGIFGRATPVEVDFHQVEKV